MTGFSSIKSIDNAISLGQYQECYFNKTSSANVIPAGGPGELFTATGSPGPITFSGTAGVGTQLSNTSAGALIPLSEGAVSPLNRYLTKFQVTSSDAAFSPGIVILVDVLFYYPSLILNATETVLDNTSTISRYTDGVGVKALVFNAATLGGAVTWTLDFIADDDGSSQTSAGVGGSSSSFVPSLIWASAGGTGANQGPLFPLTGTAQGIRSVTDYNNTGGNITGSVNLLLCRPLAMVPVNSRFITTEIDFVNQFISLPQIQDGACLGMIHIPGTATAAGGCNFSGSLQYVWG